MTIQLLPPGEAGPGNPRWREIRRRRRSDLDQAWRDVAVLRKEPR